MERRREPKSGRRVCQEGCGLPLLSADAHSCVEALRARTAALEERRAALERGARMDRLRWRRTERTLLAQVTTLQHEAQRAALEHQRKLEQHLVHVQSITQQIVGYCQVRAMLVMTKDLQCLMFNFGLRADDQTVCLG